MQSIKQGISNLITVFSIFFFSSTAVQLHADWSPPVQISAGPSSLNQSGTPLTINSNSVALVGWLDGPIGVSQTVSSANLFPQASVWTAPQLVYVNTIPGLFPSFPSTAQDMFGNSLAAFGLIDLMGMIQLEASKRPAGTINWPEPFSIAFNSTPAAAAIASDDLGNFAILLGLTTTGLPPYNITLTQIPANSTSWTTPIVLAQDTGSQPSVAADMYKGEGVLAWKISSPTLQIQSLRYNFITQEAVGAVFDVPLPPATTNIFGMDLAVDGKGDAILIFGAQTGGTTNLYTSTLLAGQNIWSTPFLVSDPANNVIGASVATDLAGNATIFWGEAITPTQQYIRVASLPLSGSLTQVTNLTSPSNLNTTVDANSQVVMDSFGNAVAIWMIAPGGVPSIQVSSKAIGEAWTAPITLYTPGINPLITLSDQGTAVATWQNLTTTVLYGSRNLFLFNLSPPTNVRGKIVKNEFLTETAYFLRISWDPSPAPNIVSYEIFKNGNLIDTVPGKGPFKFLQPLHSKRVKGTYTLVALASNGNRSLPIPITIKK